MKNIFTKHPNKVGESYLEHFFKACSFGFQLLSIALRAFVHAIFPFFFEYSTSKKLDELHKTLQDRKNHDSK